jgi:saccharopine dehydrogenase-like NADP-dependent oxidoreductase
MPTILIAGGYGAVGRKIAADLAKLGTHQIILAGRDLAKASAAALPMGAQARRINLSAPPTWPAALDGVDLVIACIDQTDTAFLAEVARRGIAYLDVTANDHFFRQAEALNVTIPVLLSVGLAPGISNLLAVAAACQLDSVSTIETGLLMGTGDEHGSAAIEWSTANMFDPAAPRDDAQVDFGPDFGIRKAYFMDFSDQHALTRTMPGVKAITRVTYDSAVIASTLFWVGHTFAGNKTIERLVARASHLPTFGSDKCVLSVTASGTRNGQPTKQTAHFFGQREAAVTAAVAALMAQEILSGNVPPGVHHSHQVIAPEAILPHLTELGHGHTIGA